jgi:UDP-N-acetylmuramoylalanine--D-glutamate ligase
MNANLATCSTKWLQRPVAIFGRGESGQAAASLIEHLGGRYQFYSQGEPSAGNVHFEKQHAELHDVVVFSPGFPSDHSWLQMAREAGCEVVGEIEFARQFWKGRVWTVSGTNGKTTTVNLLSHVLLQSGIEAIAVGNVGHAFSRAAISSLNRKESIAVCEVSSFQSETFRCWPSEAGIWTHFAPNHLDRHGDMRGYFLAKCRAFSEIPDNQLFIGDTVFQMASELEMQDQLPSGRKALSLSIDKSWVPAFLKTPAQWGNFQLCASLLLTMGVTLDCLLSALESFVPPEHRIAHIRTVDGIEFWNDSKATNSAAVQAALQQFAGRRVHWIGGGLGKGEDLKQVAATIAPLLANAYTIGTTGEELAKILVEGGIPAWYCETLDKAVDIALQQANKGDLILLSPGFASFDQFGGYAERGESFRKKVFRLSSANEVVKTINLTEKTLSSNLKDFSQRTEL